MELPDLHDLHRAHRQAEQAHAGSWHQRRLAVGGGRHAIDGGARRVDRIGGAAAAARRTELLRPVDVAVGRHALHLDDVADLLPLHVLRVLASRPVAAVLRSEEHTSELQSLMRISYAVFCLKKKITQTN